MKQRKQQVRRGAAKTKLTPRSTALKKSKTVQRSRGSAFNPRGALGNTSGY